MGFEPDQPPSEVESVNKFKGRMQAGLEEARSALTKAKEEYAQYYIGGILLHQSSSQVIRYGLMHLIFRQIVPPPSWPTKDLVPFLWNVKLAMVHIGLPCLGQ